MENYLSWIDILLTISYLGVFIITTICIFSTLFRTNTKTISSFCLLLLLFMVSDVLASDEITNPRWSNSLHYPSPILAKKIGGGLIMTYILLLFSCISIIYTEIKQVFSNI
jgi:hypothetical protein